MKEEVSGQNKTIFLNQDNIEVINSVQDGFWDWDIEKDEVYVSERWAKMLGYEPHEILPYHHFWETHVHPDDKNKALEDFKEHFEKKSHFYESLYRIKAKDGTWKWILARGKISKWGPGEKPLHAIGSYLDLSERFKLIENIKRLKSELSESQTILNAIMDYTTDAIYIKDAESRYVAINKPSANIITSLGYVLKKEDIIGKNNVDVLGAVGIEITRNDQLILTTGRSHSIEEKVGTNGSEKIYESQKSPIFDSQGRIIGIIGISRDITKQKKLESELKNAVRIRNEFLSIASHELKTPLTSLLLLAQMLRRYLDQANESISISKIKRTAVQIDSQVTRLKQLIEDMLDVTRIQSGKLSIHKSTLDLIELIQEIYERLSPQIEFNPGSQLKLSLLEKLIIQGDRNRLEQVITNLLTNALQYGEGKQVEIKTEDRNDYVLISVIDQGNGIEKEHLERIFKMFERAATATRPGGLGLGLYISKQIVEAHKGRIWVESEINKGSTFYVSLPKN